MDVTLEQAYAEACKALGEALVRERFLTQELARRDHKQHDAVMEEDGFKVYATPDPKCFAVSCDGQWLSGVYGTTPQDALDRGRSEVEKG